MRFTLAVIALSFGIAAALPGQAAPAGPRAGAWAVEVNFGAGTVTSAGGSLLRFRSDRAAWVLGLSGFVADEEIQPFFSGGATDHSTVGSLSTRIGLRSLRSPGSALRPIVGVGVLGGFGRGSGGLKTWEAGAYGELGIARFFGESFSASMTSGLQLSRHSRRAGESRLIQSRVALDAVRAAATVYF